MRPVPCSHLLPVILVMVTIFFGGCLGRSENPRFYSLTPMQQDLVIPKRENPTKNAVIGIGPVKLADYLDQNMLITRTSDNQVKKAEFDRWVGSFKDNFTNVLADNIGSLLLTDRIYLYPWRVAVPIDYQVILDIVRCDGRLGDAAWLEVRWSVFGGPGKKLLKMSRSSIREPVRGEDYAALVAAESRAVAQLSHEIVEAIQGAAKH